MPKRIKIEPEKLEKASAKLRAMAHPIRVAIIELLSINKRMNVTEIYKELEIEQATASHHLNILKTKNVLVSIRDGKNMYYSLKDQELTKFIDCLNNCNSHD